MNRELENNHRAYRGIDFAVNPKNRADLTIIDTGTELRIADSTESPIVTAVDCPFGTTVAFLELLQGRLSAEESKTSFRLRATERDVRDRASNFKSNRWWRTSAERRAQFPKLGYFNAGGHVKPTLGLEIVPAGIRKVLHLLELNHATPRERVAGMERARRGEGPVVEAHPRIFLYSAIERIFRNDRRDVTLDALDAVARYKAKKGVGKENRRRVYELLQAHPVWMGSSPRSLSEEPPASLLATDHAFDAWLCALTAWAHDHGETVGWAEAGLARETVDVEGHMLYLRTESRE